MNENLNSLRTPALLRILQKKSDSAHRISMPNLILELEEEGIPAERKSVYASIRALQDAGFDIRFSRSGGKQGYWLKGNYSPAEILVLQNAVCESPSLSASDSRILAAKLLDELSDYQAESLPHPELFSGKTDNEEVLSSISILLEAIRESRAVAFQYYDLTVTKQKRYRRSRQAYHLLPCAVISYSGRFYCVCWSEVHRSFANYRVDKMSSLSAEEPRDPVPFDLQRWMETSFMMYRGEPGTVTLRCDSSMTSIVFDRFGKDVLISETGPDHFTFSIRSSVSPTLISWILMFYDRVEVLRPDDLKKELRKIAETVLKTYPNV